MIGAAGNQTSSRSVHPISRKLPASAARSLQTDTKEKKCHCLPVRAKHTPHCGVRPISGQQLTLLTTVLLPW